MKFGDASIKLILVLLVACTHVAFLFFAYSTGVFGLALPYMMKIAIWLGCSSLIAGIAYYMVYSGYPIFRTKMP